MSTTPTVLVAEPRPEMQQILSELLTELGYRVRVYADCCSLLSGDELPFATAILTKLTMPDADAFYVLRTLREHGVSVPVFVTVPMDERWHPIAHATKLLGAAGLVYEPFSIEAIRRGRMPPGR